MVRQIQKVETAVEPRFQEHFVNAMAIPHKTAQYPNLSKAVRYNSYWVYPEPMEGFVTRDEYRNWRKDIGVRERRENPPKIRSCGLALEKRRFIPSTPVFIGDSTWVGFFEQLYPVGSYEDQLVADIVNVSHFAVLCLYALNVRL